MCIFQFYFFVFALTCTTNGWKITRADSIGDHVVGVGESQCLQWKGIWKRFDGGTCYCGTEKTFLTDINRNLGCYEGTGKYIGCSLQMSASNRSVAVFYRKDKSMRKTSIGEILKTQSAHLKSCDKAKTQIQRWTPLGWRLINSMKVKVNDRSVKISWENTNFTQFVQGQLFKISFSSCETSPSRSCLLVKNLGKSQFVLPPTTAPSLQPTTTITASPKKAESSSSNMLSIILGVCCAVLFLVFVVFFVLWLIRRDKPKNGDKRFLPWQRNKRVSFKDDQNMDNIYEDVGKMELKHVSRRGGPAEDIYLAPVDTVQRSHSGESPYIYAQHVEDFYDTPCDDLPDAPREERYSALDNSLGSNYVLDGYSTLNGAEVPVLDERYSSVGETQRKSNYLTLNKTPQPTDDESLYSEAINHETTQSDPMYFETLPYRK